MARALARRLDVAPLRSASAVAVVGAGGAGKTAVIARLATAYAAAGRLPVAVIALRPKDGGAELARLLAPRRRARCGPPTTSRARPPASPTCAAARSCSSTRRPCPATRPAPTRDALVADLRRLGLDEVHFALPAVLAGEVAREMLAAARDLGADRIAVTHTDATARLGMAVELAVEAEPADLLPGRQRQRAPRRRRGPGLRPAPMSLPALDTPVMLRIPDREALSARVTYNGPGWLDVEPHHAPRTPLTFLERHFGLPGVRRSRRARAAHGPRQPVAQLAAHSARRLLRFTHREVVQLLRARSTRAASCTRG